MPQEVSISYQDSQEQGLQARGCHGQGDKNTGKVQESIRRWWRLISSFPKDTMTPEISAHGCLSAGTIVSACPKKCSRSRRGEIRSKVFQHTPDRTAVGGPVQNPSFSDSKAQHMIPGRFSLPGLGSAGVRRLSRGNPALGYRSTLSSAQMLPERSCKVRCQVASSDGRLALVERGWEHQGRSFKCRYPEKVPNWLSFSCIEADSPTH